MTSVFLTYARGDDGEPFDPATSFVARLYRDLADRGFSVWFDRESMPSRNLTFHQEIRDAVQACDRLVLVVGPKAANSDYVRQEWQFAYFEADKVVTPILRKGDFPLVPDELNLLHCEDFRDDAQYAFHLDQLTRILGERPPQLGKLIGVPGLPAHYLSRADRLVPLRDAVRSGLDSAAPFGGAAVRHQFHGIAGTAKRVGMHGMGGIGKSVLANLLAHDRKIREAFSDGIVWVGLGSVPDVVELLRRVHRDLGGDGAFATDHEGKVKVKELLADKAVLLVLDDAWRKTDVEAFDVLGPRCRALITTRDAGLLTSLGGSHHLVELLTDEEALRLLAVAVGCELDQLPAEAPQVLRQCGRLPLAVALAGGMVAAGTPWPSLLNAFERHKLEFFEDEHRSDQHQNLWKMIEISVQALPASTQGRLVELGAFPEDEAVPEAAVATLWQHTGGLDGLDTQQLLIKLKQRSLVQLTASEAGGSSIGFIALHDLIHDYCVRRAPQQFGNETALHTRLLDAYRSTCSDGWRTGPNDGYFFDHLRTHLIAAGQVSELADLLHQLRWLETKNELGLTFDLPQDLRAAINVLPETNSRRRILRLLDEALRRDIHFIHRHRGDYPQALFQCLWYHGWWYDCPQASEHYESSEGPWNQAYEKLYLLLQRWKEEKAEATPHFNWLRSLRPPAVHLDSPLLSIFRGHEESVMSVAYSPDGRWIASGSDDRSIRVWDADTGAEQRVIRGHERSVKGVAYSPDGRRVVSGSDDKTVRVWDAATGAELLVLRGHGSWVWSVAFSPDGQRIASGSWDHTVRVWDAATGAEMCVLRGHEGRVTSVSYSPDGRRIASGAWDNTVRLWDAETGAELCILHGHQHHVNSVAFSRDGRRIASGSSDRAIRVWDAETGAELRVLGRQKGAVCSVAFSPDGRRIASGAWDNTVRLWDADGGAELHVLRGHELQVGSVTYSTDGQRVASGSWDRTVRMWDVDSGAELCVLRGHEDAVASVTYSPEGRRVASGAWDKTVRLWDAHSGAALCVLRGHENWVEGVAYSPDGRRIASGSWDHTVRIWDADTGAEQRVLRGHEGEVISVAYSPDGRRIASGAFDRTVRVWDAETGAELRVGRHEDAVQSVTFSPDGRQIASGGDDKVVRVWDADTGVELRVLRGHDGKVSSVAYSSDGRRIATGVRDDTVCVWDSESGMCLEIVQGEGDVRAIADGATYFPFRAVARVSQTVIDDAATGQPIAWFPVAFTSLTTHPDGRRWAGARHSQIYLLHLETEGAS
jgi:WD40 repeat protein